MPEENVVFVPFYDESYKPPIQFAPQILVYYSFFALCAHYLRVSSSYVHSKDESDKENYRRFRVRNLSICFLHSLISGLLTVCSIVIAPTQFTGFNVMTYTSPLVRAIPTISIGYFVHDTIDMLVNERLSRPVLELVLHHAICAYVFLIALCVDKFQPYALIAILMEINSIFLHWRSLNNLTNQPPKAPLCALVRGLNIATIIVFRFGVQFYMIDWLIKHWSHMAWQFAAIGVCGNITFLIFNYNILYRVLRSDGYLRGRRTDASFDRGVTIPPATASNDLTPDTKMKAS